MYCTHFVGKYDNSGKWASLTTHLRDTAGVMKCLVREWVSDSQIAACHMERVLFGKIAVFVAGVHDIGKCTAYFQGLITESSPYLADRLNSDGFILCRGPLYRGRTPHAFAGQWILQSSLFHIPESVASVVGAHHGVTESEPSINGSDDMLSVYPVNFYGTEKDKKLMNLWNSAWLEIVENALQMAGFESKAELPELTVEAQILITALLIMADWIASNSYFYPLYDMYEEDNGSDYEKRMNEGWNKLRFPESWEPEVSRMNKEIFEDRFHFFPNEIQEAVYQVANETERPGIFILEAQMGAGKTEAALSAAEVIAAKGHLKGIFFGLPTQATCNGIYDRLYSWADSVSEETLNAIRLAHAGAMYDWDYQQQVMQGRAQVAEEDLETGTLVHPWFQGNKRALLADFVIGTVDQFLLAVLKKKHFMLRHLGLAGKVIVIDECHSYDAYMNQYLNKALQWMGGYGVPVILLSATLPSQIRTEFVENYLSGCKVKRPLIAEDAGGLENQERNWKKTQGYPLLTWTDGNVIHQKMIQQETKHKAVRINRLNSCKDVIATIRDKLKNGGCACVILNTVKCAQSFYNMLKDEFPEWEILLYHAQFTLDDRLQKEKKIMSKMGKKTKNSDRGRFILVGTQVLEQSLDYDADILFTQLCPIDLLLQRIGRLHRHERVDAKGQSARPPGLQQPECWVISGGEEMEEYDSGSRKIYGDYLLMRTGKVLPDQINLPENIASLVQKVYDESNSLDMEGEDSYELAKQEYIQQIEKQKRRAETFLLEKPRKEITGMLTNPVFYDEEDGNRGVRDGDLSIEIILLRNDSDGIRLLESSVFDKCFHTDEMPDEETCFQMARQRVRLPRLFAQDYFFNRLMDELDERQKEFYLWKESAWLKGEEILLLDSNNTVELCGYLLYYDSETGLQYLKREE